MAVSAQDVRRARDRIAAHVIHTPLSPAPLFGRLGSDLRLKEEQRQHTGSFKVRGALNRLLDRTDADRGRGIVAASAGNHALAVAWAAERLGEREVDLFVQRNADTSKLARIKQFQIRLHMVGETFEAAQQAALAHVEKTGALYISPYDDPGVLAGQGTVGLEILEDFPDCDMVVVPVGGGSLIGGIAVAMKVARPGLRIVGVNPEASPSALESLRAGRALDPFDHAPTLAQGLAGGFGRTAYEAAAHLIDEIALVTEEEMKAAIAALIDDAGILAEASGAAAVAAVLAGKAGPGERVVAVISGGNIDSRTLARVLTTAPSPAPPPPAGGRP